MGKIQEKPGTRAVWRRVLPWALAYLGMLAASVGLAYYWRVVFQIGQISLFMLALVPVAVFSLLFLAVVLLRRFFAKNVPATAAACIFILGLLFCFVTEPLQIPDEPGYFLRAYSVSNGSFNFDYTRHYPNDVNLLYDNFPATHNFRVRYDPADSRYAHLVPESFAQYYADIESGRELDVVQEPVVRMTVPFLLQGAFVWVARMLGFTALGCMYAARIANLLVYTVLCYFAIKNCDRYRGAFIAAALLPISLYLGASCSYDCGMLAAAYLAMSYYCKNEVKSLDFIVFTVALVYSCVVKPTNIVLVAVLLVIPKERWKVALDRRVMAGVILVAAAALYFGTGAVNAALSINYFENPDFRVAGGGANPLQQVLFVLGHIPRYAATMLLTFLEDGGYLLYLGVFGSTDMEIPLVSGLSMLSLAAAAVLGVRDDEKAPGRQVAALFATVAVYVAAVMAAMYALATNLYDIRITGVQTRYFLPAFLLLALACSLWLGKAMRPRLAGPEGALKLEAACLWLAAAVGLVAVVLVFQNTYIGQWLPKGDGGHKMVNLFGWQVL